MTQPTLESFFSGGGGKSVSWKDKPIGTTVTGTIKMVHPPSQQTDYVTKELKFKKDGTPMMQVRIDLATAERDPSDPEDDGSRGLYVLGWLQGAVGDALRKAGRDGPPEVGATLSVTLTERAPSDTPGMTFNKFVASYTSPAPIATQQFFAQQPQQQFGVNQGLPGIAPNVAQALQYQPQTAAQVPQQAPPVQQFQPPVPAAQPPVMTPEQIAAFMAQQVPAQAPQQAPPVDPGPAKPDAISQLAWDQMPLETKKQVAGTMASVPAGLNSAGNPPF